MILVVRLIQPTDSHWALFQRMLREGNAGGNLVSDAHLAALALEHNCILHSTDTDFARFPGLKWENPIAKVTDAAKPRSGNRLVR